MTLCHRKICILDAQVLIWLIRVDNLLKNLIASTLILKLKVGKYFLKVAVLKCVVIPESNIVLITNTLSSNTDPFYFLYSKLQNRFSSFPFITNFKYLVSKRLEESS